MTDLQYFSGEISSNIIYFLYTIKIQNIIFMYYKILRGTFKNTTLLLN